MNFGTVIILTAFLAASGQFANTIFVPAIPMMANSLHLAPSALQGLIAAYLMPYGISQLFYGSASDKYGRKPVIYFGVSVFAFGAFISFVGINYSCVLFGCILQGIGAGVGGVMVRTLMRDCFEGNILQKANSYMTMATVFAPLIAPIIGGFLAVRFGWRTVFLFLFLFSLTVLAMQFFLMKETKPETANISSIERYKILFNDKSFFFYITLLMLAFSGIAVFEASFGVLFGTVFKISPEVMSLLFIIPIPFYLTGSFYAGSLIKRYSLDRIILMSVIIILFSSVALFVISYIRILTVTAILLPICSLMFGAGILCPTATTAALKPLGTIAGTAGAFLGGYQNIGAGTLTFVSSFIAQRNSMPLAVVLCGVSVLMILIVIARMIHTNFSIRRRSMPYGKV